MTKPIRTNKDLFRAMFKGGVSRVKVGDNAPEEVRELVNHVKESTLDKIEESEAEEAETGEPEVVETQGEEVE